MVQFMENAIKIIQQFYHHTYKKQIMTTGQIQL